jgi:hypothetical protein
MVSPEWLAGRDARIAAEAATQDAQRSGLQAGEVVVAAASDTEAQQPSSSEAVQAALSEPYGL